MVINNTSQANVKWFLVKFVYFWTFPGKIQSFQFSVYSEFVYFWTFPGKIQTYLDF